MSQTILIAVLTLLSTTVTMPTLLLVIECCHLAPVTQDPVTLIAFRFPDSVTIVPTVSSGLQRKAITELFKDAKAPLTHVFLIVVVKCLLDPPSVGE